MHHSRGAWLIVALVALFLNAPPAMAETLPACEVTLVTGPSSPTRHVQCAFSCGIGQVINIRVVNREPFGGATIDNVQGRASCGTGALTTAVHCGLIVRIAHQPYKRDEGCHESSRTRASGGDGVCEGWGEQIDNPPDPWTGQIVYRQVVVGVQCWASDIPEYPVSGAGGGCGFTTIAQGGHYEGEISGGPLFGAGTLRCSLQADVNTHSGIDAVSESASDMNGVVVMERPVSFDASQDADIVLCMEFTPTGGATRYWDGARWETSDSASCEGTTENAASVVTGTVYSLADPAICVALSASAPGVPDVIDIDPTGDTSIGGEVFWDCPPYDSSR